MAFLKINGMNVHYHIWNDTSDPAIVMLHGFTGSTHTWVPIARQLSGFRVIAIDCTGHGKTDSPADVSLYEMDYQINVLEEVCRLLQLDRFSLVGYSMGGRIALSYALKYPTRIDTLFLESASPGLKTEEERIARRQADSQLADKIEDNGIKSFVNGWENIPLFATQKCLPASVQEQIRKERLDQCAQGLANSLRGMGTGMMPPLWDRLKELQMPVTLITGKLDTKFDNIAREMTALNKKVRHLTVNDVGHAIHVENPSEFATIIKETISYIR
ncbi:2-succinyl-6-hydroxy-2,4-cyclohexadiene-1-carboxylate synthase [Lysinibacillus odysseyi]|uniref:Putative 2-succinyl-6-hydroxy-2,4-cyclohexadiene-1-carboxylate synthase n=1 Tax=Lysinibacillus odysseyi 34hs-1 = NBRC 100172 TaxID=1220589 RepID=A0A0A3IXX8_9BACI|nr:2-succinyl-6-hydroxy-2,4-cyclohexadiene-1-carboxylate synthase [Lysinibacillus odysseyi]KGR87743.1 esterase [Lysinibacillus odysseyi 34hs-1 = NBRC 100172]